MEVTKQEVYLVFLQLPDAERQHGHQQEAVENQNQRADPPPPLCAGTRHDGCFTLSLDYRHILQPRAKPGGRTCQMIRPKLAEMNDSSRSVSTDKLTAPSIAVY